MEELSERACLFVEKLFLKLRLGKMHCERGQAVIASPDSFAGA
tara:strand:- start:62 stop:190 length:129 start_codon:yes stop_codon:yes gene_type:complete